MVYDIHKRSLVFVESFQECKPPCAHHPQSSLRRADPDRIPVVLSSPFLVEGTHPMSFTKEQIQKMLESELRKQVLIPLFSQMGFRDVIEYHGGAGEQGKDIAMWKPAEFKDRTNFAVVVKATRITGQASAKNGSAREVTFQIQQAFGDPYSDPNTGEPRTVHECYIVSSHEISKEARESIRSALKPSNLQDRITFISGDTLWEHIEKQMPSWAAANELEKMRKVFDNLDKDYRLAMNLSVQPKSPQTPPCKVGIRLKFPDTPKAKATKEELERHLKTGAPFTLPKDFIAELKLPDVLKPLYGEDGSRLGDIAFGPRKADTKLAVKIEAVGKASSASLDFVDLKTEQGGMEEVTLNNKHQNVPWNITLVFNRKEPSSACRFNFQYWGHNVRQVLQAARFIQAMSTPTSIRITDLATGFEVMTINIGGPGEKPCATAPDDFFIKYLESLEIIQSRTQIPIALPDRPISEDELDEILNSAEILRTGKDQLPIESLSGTVNRDTAQKMIAPGEEPDRINIRGRGDHEIRLFGRSISLGPLCLICRKLVLKTEDRARIEELLKDPTVQKIDITLTASDGAMLEHFYPKWMPKEEADMIEKFMANAPAEFHTAD